MQTVDPDPRTARALARGWLAAHACWAASLVISVVVGAREQDCKPEVLGNGDDGPFAYRAHEWVGVAFLSLVVTGLVAALSLSVAEAIAERRGRATTRPAGPNHLFASWAVFVVMCVYIIQIDSALYCSAIGYLVTGAFIAPPVVALLLLNRAAWRSS